MSGDTPIPGTGISAVTPQIDSRRVSFQLLNTRLQQKILTGGPTATETLTANALPFSSVASVNWNTGREVRLFYLDSNYVVQEFSFTQGQGWRQGHIGSVGVKAVPPAGLAATVYKNGSNYEIRVYYQEDGSRIVKELIHKGAQSDTWCKGDLNLEGSIPATGLAAVTYFGQNQIQTRVFYQAQDLTLRDHHRTNRGWLPGDFRPGQATGRTPLSAITFGNEIQVYWRNLAGHIVFAKHTGSWGTGATISGIGPGYQFSAIEWEDGRNLRVYYQKFDGVLAEHCSDDCGSNWYPGVSPL